MQKKEPCEFPATVSMPSPHVSSKCGYFKSFVWGLTVGSLVACVLPAIILLIWTLRAQPHLDATDVAFLSICFVVPSAIMIFLGSIVQTTSGPLRAYAKPMLLATAILMVLLFPYYIRLITFLVELTGVPNRVLGPTGTVILIFGAVNGVLAGFVSCNVARTDKSVCWCPGPANIDKK